uniref:G_PROTEIN_RECEP_F1_2 domain-containing protein n=1 Tax=Ascaris lumbricoides TaxID=6252 RepID=A0A0M3IGC3_ASCLU
LFAVAERFVATRWASVYEKHGNHQPITLTLACIASASTVWHLDVSVFPPLRLLAPILVAEILVNVTSLIPIIYCLVILPYDRNKDYRVLGYIVDFVKSKLIEMFIDELLNNMCHHCHLIIDVGCFRLLAPILVAEILVNVTSLIPIIYCLVILPYDRNKDYRVLGYIVDFDLAIFMSILPWMILLRHPPYCRKIRSMLPCAINENLDRVTEPTNVNGEAIVIHETAKIHFENLKKNWV